jgi:predicted RND superfamily exporter protein
MTQRDEQRQAAETLAAIRAHQERTRRAARLPWWVYAAMFVLTAGGTAANDFVGLSGAKLISILVLVALVVVLVITFVGRSAPLSRLRGVERRQSFVPWVFVVVAVVVGLGAWLISRYGTDLEGGVAGAVGLRGYPNTVTGVLYGAAFTALFALTQLLITASQRRANP